MSKTPSELVDVIPSPIQKLYHLVELYADYYDLALQIEVVCNVEDDGHYAKFYVA